MTNRGHIVSPRLAETQARALQAGGHSISADDSASIPVSLDGHDPFIIAPPHVVT